MEFFTNVEPNCTVDPPQLCVCKDQVEEEEGKRGTFLDQEQPEPLQIKEEEEELCGNQDVEHLLLKQEIKSECDEPFLIQFEDHSEKHICKEETEAELIWKQEKSSSLDEEEPHLPQIKEAQEEICINEKGEQFELKQETDAFMEANIQIRNSDAVSVQLDSPSHESSHCCDTCGKVYIRSANLKTHMKTHTGEKPFTCKICKKCFPQSMTLKKHFRTHTSGKLFSCEICQKVFIQAYSLTCHMRTHTGEKPFTCNVCEKTFSQSCNLKVHQRSHTGERPFTCKVCEKSFTQNSVLKAHMRTHTGEKPFSCTVCVKKFSKSTHLKAHMRIHTNVKHVSCKIYPKPTILFLVLPAPLAPTQMKFL